MLLKVSANRPNFRTVRFRQGLNIVLGERSTDATAQDSTNALGKSMLIEIIDFCLGANATQGSGLLVEALKGWDFSLQFSVGSATITATRGVDRPERIYVRGIPEDWTPKVSVDEETGQDFYVKRDWTDLLGKYWFGLQLPPPVKFAPSFRSLISYVVRSGDAAYGDPLRYFPTQTAHDVQVHVAFLLGLAWENACKWEELSEREKAAKAFKDAIEKGLIPGLTSNIGELEAERGAVQTQVERGREALQTFKVHPQYEDLERRADALSEDIHATTNRLMAGRRKLTLYRKAVREERAPEDERIEQVWREAGVIFGDSVKATLEQAKAFHANLVSNRQSFLGNEIDRLKREVSDLEDNKRQMLFDRASIMATLQTHGAINEFTLLQQEQNKHEQRLEKLVSQINDIKRIASDRREIRIERATLAKATQLDFDARQEYLDQVRRRFHDVSTALYGTSKPGRLIIDVADRGMKFATELEGDESTGVGKMRMFCFDVAVLGLHASTNVWPKFLVHDSVMFDGVDPRQRAHAFEFMAKVCSDLGVQYICTLNEDMVPIADFSSGFSLATYVVHRLHDAKDDGLLFGFRFER